MNTEVVATDPLSGEEIGILLSGCAGYLPVYDNRKQAEDAAMYGKYEIIAIITK